VSGPQERTKEAQEQVQRVLQKQGVKLFGNRDGSTWISPGGIDNQKTVGGSKEATSLSIGSWHEPLRLTLDASLRKKASLPEKSTSFSVQRGHLSPRRDSSNSLLQTHPLKDRSVAQLRCGGHFPVMMWVIHTPRAPAAFIAPRARLEALPSCTTCFSCMAGTPKSPASKPVLIARLLTRMIQYPGS
jgi:hypothetical protein